MFYTIQNIQPANGIFKDYPEKRLERDSNSRPHIVFKALNLLLRLNVGWPYTETQSEAD